MRAPGTRAIYAANRVYLREPRSYVFSSISSSIPPPPPIYSNLSNDSKFATNFPFAPSLALQKIVQKTMKWGKKYPISIRTVQISVAKGSDRIRPSFLHLPRNSFVSRPPPRRDVPAAVARCQQPWWDEGVEWPAGKIVKQRCREILVVSIKRGAVIERKDVAERAA